jgi:hypothetical protein
MAKAGMRIEVILERIKIQPAAAPGGDRLEVSRPVLAPQPDHQARPIKGRQIENLK